MSIMDYLSLLSSLINVQDHPYIHLPLIMIKDIEIKTHEPHVVPWTPCGLFARTKSSFFMVWNKPNFIFVNCWHSKPLASCPQLLPSNIWCSFPISQDFCAFGRWCRTLHLSGWILRELWLLWLLETTRFDPFLMQENSKIIPRICLFLKACPLLYGAHLDECWKPR